MVRAHGPCQSCLGASCALLNSAHVEHSPKLDHGALPLQATVQALLGSVQLGRGGVHGLPKSFRLPLRHYRQYSTIVMQL